MSVVDRREPTGDDGEKKNKGRGLSSRRSRGAWGCGVDGSGEKGKNNHG